nr:ATP-dependent helicase [uncultured Anaerosporobacter sp.]
MNNREKICVVLCGLKKCDSDISKCKGYENKRCKYLKKSFIQNMNDNQVQYVTTEMNKNVFLKACPGSGKTEVLAIKIAYELQRWKLKNQGLAILTFTNSAEDEIVNRIDCFVSEKIGYPHFVGTFTSWLHGYIANPFLHMLTDYKGDETGDKSFRLIDNDCTSGFLNAFITKYSYKELQKIKANEIYYDLKTDKFRYCGKKRRDGNDILNELLELDKYRMSDLWETKNKFWEAGFASYEDIEWMTYDLLQDNPELVQLIVRRFPVLFVDECQDLSYIQLQLISLLIEKGAKIHFIGDLNQSIYGFRNIEPNDTREFIQEQKFCEMLLNENYRSCQSIVNASEYLVNNTVTIHGRNTEKVKKSLIAILYTNGKEKEAINKYKEYLTDECFKDCRIIVRTNNLKNKLLGFKNQNQSLNNLEMIAEVIYLINNTDQVDNFRRCFEVLANSIQRIFFNTNEHLNKQYFYKPKEIELADWKKLLLKIKKILESENQLFDFSTTWDNWKKCLNAVMVNKVQKVYGLENTSYKIGNIRSGNKNKSISEVLFDKKEGKIEFKIETIHGCKGMSLDSVFFLSSYQKNNQDEHSGGYWKQWFELDEIEEENRLAYVAFSRAKYLLALGIPKPRNFSEADRKILNNAGFEIIEVE